MRYLQILKVAYRALTRNKMRSSLTMLGIIIGVGAVIAMVAIGQGAKKMIDAQVSSLGDNLLTVFSGSHFHRGVRSATGTVTNLTDEDAQAILENCPAVTRVTPRVRTGAQIIAGNLNWATSVEGYAPDFVYIRSWPVASGTFFTNQDVRGATKVCVLGKTLVDELFAGQDPVGEIIRINKLPFRILGVLSPKGDNAFGRDQDDIVIVPYTTAQKKLIGITHVQYIMVSAVDRSQIDVAEDQITQLLRQRHKIPPGEEDDFRVRSQLDLASVAGSTSKIMTILLAAIASVSLIVGGIGIMNIMLVSVTERTREIGIRKALGAKRRNILWQFLIEAMTLTGSGGIMGIIFGAALGIFVGAVTPLSATISLWSVIVGFSFSVSVGLFFGIYPATRAAKLDPIEALRYE